jgi:phospholipid transport system substrate-binding protein
MFCRILKGKKFAGLAVIMLLAIVPQWTMASTSNPLAVIQSGTDRALQIIRASHKGDAPSLRQRRSELLTIVDEYFDFEGMGKTALGRPWKEQSPENRQEFVKLFKQLLFNTYISRIEKLSGTKEKAYYDSEKFQGDYALVKTHMDLESEQNVSLDYRFHLENGQWKVYDVVVEGVSLVENYRSQFASILTGGTFDVLLQKLREKVEQQG